MRYPLDVNLAGLLQPGFRVNMHRAGEDLVEIEIVTSEITYQLYGVMRPGSAARDLDNMVQLLVEQIIGHEDEIKAKLKAKDSASTQ